MTTATAAVSGLTYESFSFWLGLASGVLLLTVALVLILLRRRGHVMPRTIPLACLLYGLGSLLNAVGRLLPEPGAISLVAVMVLLSLAGLTCIVMALRELRRSRAS